MALAALPANAANAEAPVLTLPIDCILGETCYIQNYVDRDPGPKATNFACQSLTYDGHKGTDIALPSLAAMRDGVNVLASANGVVTGMRDGMTDIIYKAENADTIKGRDCGNGLVLRHADGWETQYCHMKKGSVQVTKGMAIKQGDVLGQVGLSGRTQFPHVHLSVRHNRAVIDPFDTGAALTCGTLDDALWQDVPDYVAGNLINIGFAASVPKYSDVKDGATIAENLSPKSAALVLWGYAYGSKPGDIMHITITGPNNFTVDTKTEITKRQAQYFRAAGKKSPRSGWALGDYFGTVRLIRDNREIGKLTTRTTIGK